MLKPETEKKLTSLMESWVHDARHWLGGDTSLADHAVIYLRGAAAALNEIDYQNDFPKIEFRDAIYDVVRDLSERGIDALKEWLTKLNIKPQKIAETEAAGAGISISAAGRCLRKPQGHDPTTLRGLGESYSDVILRFKTGSAEQSLTLR